MIVRKFEVFKTADLQVIEKIIIKIINEKNKLRNSILHYSITLFKIIFPLKIVDYMDPLNL
jgi:hypothetical protein